MPWKEQSVMDQRMEFALQAAAEVGSFTELCRSYGISTKTGYKWKQRFMEQGLSGLGDRSRKPASSPRELSELTVCQIVRLKQAHPSWGASKLRYLYQKAYPSASLPSESSFKRILERCNLVEHRPHRVASAAGRIQNRFVPCEPNALWTVDFKGWWYTPGGQRCEPLTVRDAFSRYLLSVSIPPDARTQTIRQEFIRIFETYGLPATIRSDNGRPFAVSTAPLGLSRLSAWWLVLGIDLDRTEPGHPEQNGGHERMHRDLSQEIEGTVKGELPEQAAALEIWRQSFNEERPHQALGMRPPAELYHKSTRPYSGTPEQLAYPVGYLQRRVSSNGHIRIDGVALRISEALAGWNVGLLNTGRSSYAVYFARLCLGSVETDLKVFRPAGQLKKEA